MIINFGSLNIDYVYSMDKIVKPGETLSSFSRDIFPGGKGLNQSVALARAGAAVRHAGYAGKNDGMFLVDLLQDAGVDISLLKIVDAVNGHAVIQVEKSGENCIILYGGTNQMLDADYVATVASTLKPGDLVVFQNETSMIGEMMLAAKAKGARIALNPSPMDQACLELPLNDVDIFLMNEGEGESLTGEKDPDAIMDALTRRFNQAKIVLTLGARGCLFGEGDRRFSKPAAPCGKIIDTTAAGDTFTGYYLASIEAGMSDEEAIERAATAASKCIEQKGAAVSIPVL